MAYQWKSQEINNPYYNLF